MKQTQYVFSNGSWSSPLPNNHEAQLLLAFGDSRHIADQDFRDTILQAFPRAELIGCTTSGEIADTEIYDDSLCLTAIHWRSTETVVKSRCIAPGEGSFEAGCELARMLPEQDLKYVLVISNGLCVNGSQLVAGLEEVLPSNVLFSGGLAGDGDRFEKTWVWHNDKREQDLIVLCGLYGEALQVESGCLGGWEPFGPARQITSAEANVLRELDGEPALALYKKYLGEHAESLPASALLFPLYLQKKSASFGVVRTILQINEEDGSMVFAGDMEEGDCVKLMRSTNDKLIDAAETAADKCLSIAESDTSSLALLVSCVGRRLVLKQRTEEELEAVRETLGDDVTLCGFYSYGEISPDLNLEKCMLHNQTMTITVFSEHA